MSSPEKLVRDLVELSRHGISGDLARRLEAAIRELPADAAYGADTLAFVIRNLINSNVLERLERGELQPNGS